MNPSPICFFFFFNDTATTEIYTLSLHDALPICSSERFQFRRRRARWHGRWDRRRKRRPDRKSTRLNSSHLVISYAVFCFKKKKHVTMSLTSYCTQTPSPLTARDQSRRTPRPQVD